MTDLLQSLKSAYEKRINEMEAELALIDAQLGSKPVIPVDPPKPPDNPILRPSSGNPFLDAYLQSGSPVGALGGSTATVTTAGDRWAGAFTFGPSEQFWRGGAGDVSSLGIPVPAGWRGSLEAMAGESSEAGAKVDQFDLWFSAAPNQPPPPSWPRFDRGSYGSITLKVDHDIGVIYLNVHQWQAGGGFAKLNPIAA